MTEEERNETTEDTPDAPPEEAQPEAAEEAPAEPAAEAEEPAAEEAPAEEPGDEAEEPAAEEAGDDPSADPAPAAPAPPAAEEPSEVLSPKERRRQERSLHRGDAKPQRGPEERTAERAAERAAKAASRRRRRASERGKRGEPGQGTPPGERLEGTRRVQLGKVVSDKADKTITVQVDVVRRHRRYEKVVRHTATLHAHDERNEAGAGDVVRVVESRPLSRSKRWRLVEVVEKAR